MRKLFLVLLIVLMPASVFADSKLSALSNNGSPTGSDLTYDVAGGTSYNVTLTQLKTLINTGVQLSLSLAAGSYVNGDVCTYASSGTLLNCNTAPAGAVPASGTSGQEAYYTGTGTIGSTSNQYIVGNNLGIGTSTPGTVLDVQGTVRSVGVNVQAGNVGIDTMAISGQLLDVYGTLPILNITPSTFIVTTFGINNNYNIGIGTTSPNAMLDIASPGAYFAPNDGNGSNYTLKLHSNVDQDNLLLSNNNNTSVSQSNGGVFVKFTTPDHYAPGLGKFGTLLNTLMLQTYQNVNLGLGTNAKDQMTFVTSPNGGNIGIGTIVPLNALDIESTVGDTVFSGVAQSVGTLGNVGIGSLHPGTILDVQGTIRTTGFTLNKSPVAGDILMSNNIGVGSWQPASSVGSGVGGSGTVSSGTNFDVAYYNGTGTAVSGDSNVYTNGTNVGIGTYNFNNALDVDGGVGIGSTANSNYLTVSSPSGSLIVQNNIGVGTWLPNGILDVAGTIQHLYVAVNGNVGIGSVTPQTALDVNGSGNFGGTGSSILFNKANNFSIGTSNSTNMITVLPTNGNVGIGSTAPGALLDVNGTARFLGISLGGVTNTSWPSGSSQWTTQNTHDVSLAGGNVGIGTTKTTTSALTIMNGNVGIGTWVGNSSLGVETVGHTAVMINPKEIINGGDDDGTETLEMQQLGTTNGSGIKLISQDSNGTARWWIDTNDVQRIDNLGSATGMISLNGAGSPPGNVGIGSTNPGALLVVQGTMEILGSGNVGIGSQNPGEALDINGSIRVFNIKSTTGNRYVCVNSSGVFVSQTTACVGT